MTTAELIKKREEEKNKPSVAQQSDALKQQVNAAYESKSAPTETNTLAGNPNGISLYEVGKANASTGVANAENSVKNPSPINTKEMEDFRNQVIGVRDFGVETPEQAAARERRDYIKQGLTGLTEGLSSLANLYYTTKWAPNQKIVSQMPVLQQQLYRERLERDKKLENFRAWQRAKADKDADRAYQEKVTADNRAYQDGVRKAQWEREDKIREQNQANLDREFEYKVNKDTEETAYRRKKDEEDTKRWWANFGLQKDRIEERNSSSRSSGSGKSSKMAVINTPKGVMDVDFGRINETTYNQMYNNVSKEIKDMFPINSYDDEKTVQQKRGEAISYALQKQEGYSDWLEKAGVGTYQLTPLQPQVTSTEASKSVNPWAESPDYETFGGTDKPYDENWSETHKKGNVTAYQSPAPPEQQNTVGNSGNNQDRFATFFKEVQDRRDYEAKVEAEKERKAVEAKKTELDETTNLIDQYNAQLEKLNSQQIPHADNEIKRLGLVGSDARKLKDMVREFVDEKNKVKSELKELQAKQKRLKRELGYKD